MIQHHSYVVQAVPPWALSVIINVVASVSRLVVCFLSPIFFPILSPLMHFPVLL